MSALRLDYPPQIVLSRVGKPVDASVEIPGSKSITNRALLLAALASGTSILRKPLFSDDTVYMTNALRLLGTTIGETSKGDLHIEGMAGDFRETNEPLFIGNSGTSVRFLTAACVHSPRESCTVIDGIDRMRQRPIQDLIDALYPLGGIVQSVNETGCPPVRIIGGGLEGGVTTVNGAISSQYLSALMMSAPLARADTTIKIRGELVSQPYVAMTRGVMRSFGVDAQSEGLSAINILGRQSYVACDYEIEPDASNASYFLAAAAVTGGKVTVNGLGSGSIQGDVHFAKSLEQTGCFVEYSHNSISVTGPDTLQPVDIDLKSMPDMAQTVAAICLFANGQSRIRGIHTLKVKETDRISAVANELRKLGATVEAGSNYWIIDPPTNSPNSANIHTYDDHRMAMSFAVAGLRIDGIVIEEPGCVAKTFPDFWQRWNSAFYGSELKFV